MENNDNNMDQKTKTKKGVNTKVATGITAVTIIGLAFLGVYLFSGIMSDDNEETKTTKNTCVSTVESDLPSFIKGIVPDADLECDTTGDHVLGNEAVGIVKKIEATTKEEIVNEAVLFTQSLNISDKAFSESTFKNNLYQSYPWLDPRGVSLAMFEAEVEKNLKTMPKDEALQLFGDETKLIEYLRQLSTELNNLPDGLPLEGNWNFNFGVNFNTNGGWNPLDFCASGGCGHGTYCMGGGCMKVDVEIDFDIWNLNLEIGDWSLEWWIYF
ncbi:MAG: hypothetical protein ISR95_06700 [Candidatus Marinimicrobia bacterium]|nr:hypothetical protein [Candidatus Neomarinimicrobiota bacterium]